MFERIRSWFRPAPTTNEDLEARAEGKQNRDEVDTLRTGGLRPTGPTLYGGSESRHGFDE